ncbi:hypothetical protein JCM8097_000034 [Rhodosporidiobolus ruineniae]
MPSSTRSGKAVTKKTPTSLELSTALFRDEVKAMLARPPPMPPHVKLKRGEKVEVYSTIHRMTTHGMQESIQVCGVGDQTWVTRTEGVREHFPRIARVPKPASGSKRVRTSESDDEALALEDDERTPTSSSRKKSRTSTSSRKSGAPAAPRKSHRTAPSRRPRYTSDSDSDDSDDDGATTETEHSHLARRHGGTRGAAPLASSSAASSSKRRTTTTSSSRARRDDLSTSSAAASAGLRRSARQAASPAALATHIKPEPVDDDHSSFGRASRAGTATGDELSSLCGGINGLDVWSSVEDTDAETSAAAFSAVNKGKARAVSA